MSIGIYRLIPQIRSIMCPAALLLRFNLRAEGSRVQPKRQPKSLAVSTSTLSRRHATGDSVLPPTGTVVVVSGLARPEMLLEIEVVAYVESSAK